MAGENKKYKKLLTQIATDDDLETWDPSEISADLALNGIISPDDHEKIKNHLDSNVERKLHLFVKVLPYKSEENVIPILKKIANKKDIAQLKRLLAQYSENQGGQQFEKTRQFLKNFYRGECEIMKKQWESLIKFSMDEMYIDLEIMEDNTETHASRSLTSGSCLLRDNLAPDTMSRASNEQDARIDSYKKLFGTTTDGYRRFRKIVLEGDPGMGKTTYAHRLVQQWADGDAWLNEEFDLVVLVRLGRVQRDQDLEGYLKDRLGSDQGTDIAGAITQFIMNNDQQRILFVLDAFDEMDRRCELFNEFIQHMKLKIRGEDTLLPLTTVLVTTRISHSSSRILKEKADVLFRTCGFNPEVAKAKFAGKITNTEMLTEQHDQVSLYRNPLFVGMAAFVRRIPEELFDLMEEFCNTVFQRFQSEKGFHLKAKRQKLDKPEMQKENAEAFDNKQILIFLGKIAFLTVGDSIPLTAAVASTIVKLLKSEVESNPELVKLCCRIGLLWDRKKTSSYSSPPRKRSVTEQYTFPHQLFAEYFVAHFLTELNFIDDIDLEACDKRGPISYFISGVSNHWKQKVLKNLVRNTIWIFPWVYNPSLGDMVATGIIDRRPTTVEAGFLPNHGKFLNAVACESDELIRLCRLEKLEQILFDASSKSFLQCLCEQWKAAKIKLNEYQLGFALCNLSKIIFKECKLDSSGTDVASSWLKTANHLSHIVVINCSEALTEVIFESLPYLKHLEHLALTGCSQEMLKLLATNLLQKENQIQADFSSLNKSRLKISDLRDCKLNTEIFAALPQSLEELTISFPSTIHHEEDILRSLASYLKTCTSLKHLTMHAFLSESWEKRIVLDALPLTLVSLDLGNLSPGVHSDDLKILTKYLAQSTTLRKFLFSYRITTTTTPFIQSDGVALGHNQIPTDTRITLSNQTIIPIDGASDFISSLVTSNITSLNMSNLELTQENVRSITDCLLNDKVKALKHLDLSLNKAVGAEPKFADGLHRAPLKHLCLRICDLSEDFLKSLTVSLQKTKTLRHLDISCNELVGAVLELAHAIFTSSLAFVGLHCCQLSMNFVDAMTQLLDENTKLKELCIAENPIVGEVPEFAVACVQSAVEIIDLRSCKLSSSFIDEFVSVGVYTNKKFNKVHMSRSDVGDHLLKEVLEQRLSLDIDF